MVFYGERSPPTICMQNEKRPSRYTYRICINTPLNDCCCPGDLIPSSLTLSMGDGMVA